MFRAITNNLQVIVSENGENAASGVGILVDMQFDGNLGLDLDHDACYRALAARDARFDGRIFVGVHTTGIYCRPICPARTPKRENVTFFATASAAQEAGFRPCLRCRPESSPDLGAWRGTSNTVSRALRLIGECALDQGDVDALAERLGVGERQLRRLFRQHLGASPIAVAQTRRVLFAKKLIVETTMPLAEIALASGFGSIRRFNATFRTLYNRPPRELRRSRASHNERPASAGITLILPYSPPYDWDAMIGFLGARAIPGVEVVDGSRSYRRSIALDGAQGIVAVEPDERGLKVTIHFPRVESLAEIVERVRRVFDLGADPMAIGKHLSRDRLLAPLVARRPGLRVPGAWDGFELAVRAVFGQQIPVRAAAKIAGKLVASYGDPLDGSAEDGLTHTFPTLTKIADADLRSLRMPSARAVALSSLAAAVKADRDFLSQRETLDAAITKLRSLRGVGEWTAHYIAMRALREPDAFPAADIGLMRAVAGRDGSRPTAADLMARAEPWRPWRAYAAQHLWAADADMKPSSRSKRRPSVAEDNADESMLAA
jgi:AraC family transcriptional regulator, regulatory protein of adaptative response / DNA-3-methyladenine glycosylase II